MCYIRYFAFGNFEQSLINNCQISDYHLDWHGYPLLPGETNNSVFLSSAGIVFDIPLGFYNETDAASDMHISDNAFLSRYWNPNTATWIRFTPASWRGGSYFSMAHNSWGTTSTILIDAAILDYVDDFNLPRIVYQPILTTPAESTYPFVWKVDISQDG